MKCPRCNIRPKKKHFNAKWCVKCAEELKARPVHHLTDSQIKEVKRLAETKKYSRDDIAKKVGVSRSSLQRWARDHKFRFWYRHQWKGSPELTQKVCEYYAEHGIVETKKKFGNKANIRSIVERYYKTLGLPPRQNRWSTKEFIELAKYGGILNYDQQAKIFNRPNANAGSIKSAHMKKFGHGLGAINGLSWHVAKHYVLLGCPCYNTRFYEQKRGASRRLVLWVDMEKHLRADVPDHLKSAIAAMAKFQRWLHGRNVRLSIEQILRKGDSL